MDATRRRILKAGLAGAVALAIGGGIAWFRGRTDAAAAAPAFDADARGIVRAVARSLLAGLPPASRRELAELFALLSLAAGRRMFAGVASPWSEASRAEIDAVLAAWQSSGWSLKRTAYDALHQLVLAAWYANPRSWPAIGYPGPPVLAA